MNANLQGRSFGQTYVSNPKFKYEILSRAMVNDCIEVIDTQNNFIELELSDLVKKGLVLRAQNKYNCRPFRDLNGNLHKTIYLQITQRGIAEYNKLFR
jgi:hypothetical protein